MGARDVREGRPLEMVRPADWNLSGFEVLRKPKKGYGLGLRVRIAAKIAPMQANEVWEGC